MGMHVGFIAAACEWPALHASLGARCGTLTDAGQVAQGEWFDFPSGQDVFHVASDNGRSYMVDPSMVLSADSDLVVALAEELSCVVVGAGGETVSGSFWLTAADAEGLRRLYFDVAATLTQPFDLGDPLPSEAAISWNDIDGAGILARIRDLGFSTGVLESGPPSGGRRVMWEAVVLPDPGPLTARINEHCERHEKPSADDWMKNITVHARADGGFDIQATQRAKPERDRRLRALFKRGR